MEKHKIELVQLSQPEALLGVFLIFVHKMRRSQNKMPSYLVRFLTTLVTGLVSSGNTFYWELVSQFSNLTIE